MKSENKRRLIELLLDHKELTQADIAALCDVGLRTVERVAADIKDKPTAATVGSPINTSDNCSFDEDNSTLNQAAASSRTRTFAKLVYPTKEQYETWYEDHRTYPDPETGEALPTPHYEGEDGYGQTPDNWKSILRDMHVGILVSPMHACDRNPDGKVKKPHYHVMIMFDGVKTQAQADRIFDRICAVGHEEIQSTRGYARYLTHMDNPEKFQYTERPESFGAVDYDAIINLPGDVDAMLREIFKFIRENNIISFANFLDVCALNNPDWFRVATAQRSYVIDKYIKSYAWKLEKQQQEFDVR